MEQAKPKTVLIEFLNGRRLRVKKAFFTIQPDKQVEVYRPMMVAGQQRNVFLLVIAPGQVSFIGYAKELK